MMNRRGCSLLSDLHSRVRKDHWSLFCLASVVYHLNSLKLSNACHNHPKWAHCRIELNKTKWDLIVRFVVRQDSDTKAWPLLMVLNCVVLNWVLCLCANFLCTFIVSHPLPHNCPTFAFMLTNLGPIKESFAHSHDSLPLSLKVGSRTLCSNN